MTQVLDPFLQHRKNQELAHLAAIGNSEDPLDSLVSVELNLTELCNRKCPFCPRIDPEVYPNRNLMMDLEISAKVAQDLADIGYKGRISFSGYGESLLNPRFADHIRNFRAALPESTIETNSNGDRLTLEKVHELFDAGISAIYVNMYDGPEQAPHFEKLFAKAGIGPDQFKLRPHWPEDTEDFGLTLNNRSGMVSQSEINLGPVAEPLKSKCFYSFYKMFVDWNGNVLFCANDWGREIIIGNVRETSVADLWMSPEMAEVRDRLSRGDRSASPCNKCNIEGTLHGRSSFDNLMAYYKRNGDMEFWNARKAS